MWLTTSNVDLLYRISLCANSTSDTQTLAQPIASTGDRSFKDRAPDLLPTSVLEHHPLNGMLADFPFGFSPTPKYIIYFGS
jgi:hypothetical protein